MALTTLTTVLDVVGRPVVHLGLREDRSLTIDERDRGVGDRITLRVDHVTGGDGRVEGRCG